MLTKFGHLQNAHQILKTGMSHKHLKSSMISINRYSSLGSFPFTSNHLSNLAWVVAAIIHVECVISLTLLTSSQALM